MCRRAPLSVVFSFLSLFLVLYIAVLISLAMDEDTDHFAITSSAASWYAGALPTFVAVNPSSTTGEATDSSNAQAPPLLEPRNPDFLPHPPLVKRKLQPDHCNGAVDAARHTRKAHRLQMLDNGGSGAADFRHVASQQRSVATDYTGLAPSSRSSKQPLAMSDSQMYRKRAERKASTSATYDAIAAAVSEGRTRTPSRQPKESSQQLAPPSPSPPRQRSSSSPLSPSISASHEHTHIVIAAPLSSEGSVGAARRDSSVVHVNTPEVLPPTTPRKAAQRSEQLNSPPSLQPQKPRTTPPRHPSSDLLSPENLAHASHLQGGMAHLHPTSAAALAFSSLTSNPESARDAAACSSSPQEQRLPVFRRGSSRVTLVGTLSAGEEEEDLPSMTPSSSKTRRIKAKEAAGSAGDYVEDSKLYRSVRRVSSTKTLSIVWVKRKQNPTSASHRALLRQQKLLKDPQDKSGQLKGQPLQQPKGKKKLPVQPRKAPQSNSEPLQESIGVSPAAAEMRADAQRHQQQRCPPAAQRQTQRGQMQKSRHQSVERLPPLTGSYSDRNARLPPPPVSTRTQGARAASCHTSLPTLAFYNRVVSNGSDAEERSSSRKESDGMQPFPDVMLPLVLPVDESQQASGLHYEQQNPLAADPFSSTLEAVLARHSVGHVKSTSYNPYQPHVITGPSASFPRLSSPSHTSFSPLQPDEQELTEGNNRLSSAAAQNGASVPSTKGQKTFYYPLPPARQSNTRGSTCISSIRNSVAPSARSSDMIEKQKLAPLVVGVSDNNRSFFTSLPKPASLSHLRSEVHDVVGHRNSIDGQSSTSKKDSDAQKSLFCDTQGEWDELQNDGDEITAPPVYPSVAPRSAPHTCRLPASKTKASKAVATGTTAGDGPRAPPTPPAPQPPEQRKLRPPVPRQRRKPQKPAAVRQLMGFAFAPYMAHMRSIPRGRARYTPAMEAYHNGNVHQQRRTKKTKVKGQERKKQQHHEQHVEKPKPIDYTALATQSDPLDYLLGRHGFWGESTTR
jgi:hypothetical protein